MEKEKRRKDKLKAKPKVLTGLKRTITDKRRLPSAYVPSLVRPRGYKTLFMHNSTEHDFYLSNKGKIT